MALAGTGLLLVVDNCEHVTGAAGEVLGALATSVPGLRVVATSREPFGIDAEQVLPLRPLPVPTGTLPQDVRVCAAGQLFLDRALAASPRFRLDEASAPHVAAICRRLDGLPLAIELAAARVRNLDIAELAEGLTHHLGDLARPAQTGRHKSLSSAIEWSWQLLDQAERGLLRRLAVLPGEFTLPLAAAICPSPELRSMLVRLVERSLVSVRLPEGEPARYWLLGVIRAFVLEQPDPAADEQVPRAHALFCYDVAVRVVRARYHPAPAGQPAAGFDEPNILAALAWSAAHDPGLADRLLVAVCQLVETEPSRQALELIRAVATRAPVHWGSEALARASMLLSYLSLGDAEQLAGSSALAAAGERDKAFARCASGWVHAYRHEESDALRQLDPVISYARRTPDPWLEGTARQARGVARRRVDDSFYDWEQAVTRFVVSGDLIHANNVRYMLASRAVEARTRLTDVPVWLDDCESYVASRGYQHELAHIRRVRGSYQRIQGHPGAAWELLEVALPVFRHAGDFRCTCRVLFELAQLARAGDDAAGDPAVAMDLLLQCLGVAAVAGDPAVPGRVLADLVGVAAAAGDLVLAARCLGALDAVGKQSKRENAGQIPAAATGSALTHTLAEPAYATFVGEGRAGGIDLILTLYPRLPAQIRGRPRRVYAPCDQKTSIRNGTGADCSRATLAGGSGAFTGPRGPAGPRNHRHHGPGSPGSRRDGGQRRPDHRPGIRR
jgi:hypothetical protein